MKQYLQKFNLLSGPKWIIILILSLSLLGFIDAVYLTVDHYTNTIPPCSFGSCETVLTSQYAVILGIPTALLGSIYYLFLMIFLFLYLDFKKEIFLKIPFFISAIGLLLSVFFILLMIFVIKAICIYCIISDTISIGIFCLFIYYLWKSQYSLQQVQE